MGFLKLSSNCVKGVLFNYFHKIWSSFELFILVFILLYIFFESNLLIICIILGVLGKLYNLQDYFLYHPNEPAESRFYVEPPTIYGLPYEPVDIKTTDSLRLHAYFIKQRNPLLCTAPTIIFFHGNAGNIGQRLYVAKQFFNVNQCNVLMVDYRGYGLSEGTPSESGFFKDADAACDYLFSRTDIDKKKIILYGQSIGGAVAIHTAFACKYDFYALMVENTFTTLPDIGKELFSAIPFIKLLPDVCFKSQYRSLDKIYRVQIPCLFLSGLADTLVPPKMMAKLFEKSNSPLKRMVKIEHGDHNNTWAFHGYFESINTFLSEVINFDEHNTSIE